MKRYSLLLILLLSMHGSYAQRIMNKHIDTKTDASFRALSVVNDNVMWVGGSKGWVGVSTNGGSSWTMTQVKGFEKRDLRTLYAFDAKTAVVANAGSPACILRTTDGGKTWKELYSNSSPEAFFDGIDFWNGSDGIIYGDPIKGRMLILRTADGGRTWHELREADRPTVQEGESAFAASGTGIQCFRSGKVMIGTGGRVAKMLISTDKGAHWRWMNTPMTYGQMTKGIFSMAFASETTGVIVGGDYKQDTLRKDHVFYTRDEGLSWHAPMRPTRGYRECAEYLTDDIIVAAGPSGTDISYDGGVNWQPFSDEAGYHVVKRDKSGTHLIFAGSRGSIMLVKW